MDIVTLIRESKNIGKNIPMIMIVNSVLSELNKNEFTKVIDKDKNDLVMLSHLFHSSTDTQTQIECLQKIADILSIYSNGENLQCDIEAELSILAGM